MRKAHIISVNMGYGHQRTAYPLKALAFEEKVINANDYQGIPDKDKKIWEMARKSYEFISRFKRVPLLGNILFSVFDKFQKILVFYPKRDLSKPNFSLKQNFALIKKGWGKHLIEKLEEHPLPLASTFFTPAFMAEFFNYSEEIYCIVCDADVSRVWASLKPGQSRIKYFVPNSWVNNRLQTYGVKKENIFLTGYPLPRENTGTENLEILKEDLGCRLLNLDPEKRYFQRYKSLINRYLGDLPENPDHALTILFSIGGAGAQKEIAFRFIKSLKQKIKANEIKVILSAGIRKKVKEYFTEKTRELGLNIEIIFAENMEEYFKIFNEKLRKTDILWTKPSELSFYSALGIPIIIAPAIGSQEDFNKKWLLALGTGVSQENPDHADQWIFDYLKSGRFAEAAMQGFVEGEKSGTFNIERLL